jgi:hypothetical protein
VSITAADFRKNLPAFQDKDKFDDSAVNFWLDIGQGTNIGAMNPNSIAMINAQRWGNVADLGVQLFAAHNLILEAQSMAAVKVNGLPGEYVGSVQSESVDKVSVNYDTSTTVETDAGHWNLTIYGKRFIRFARMAGAGGIQLGIGMSPPFGGPAWPGPLVLMSPTPDG